MLSPLVLVGLNMTPSHVQKCTKSQNMRQSEKPETVFLWRAVPQWHHESVSVYYSQNTWESYPTTVVGLERQNWCLDCARALNSEVVWGLFSNCALLSVRSSGVTLPGAKTQCQGDHQGEQARTRKSLQGTTDCLCSRQNCKGRPIVHPRGMQRTLFLTLALCVCDDMILQNIWYKLLTTDGLQ